MFLIAHQLRYQWKDCEIVPYSAHSWLCALPIKNTTAIYEEFMRLQGFLSIRDRELDARCYSVTSIAENAVGKIFLSSLHYHKTIKAIFSSTRYSLPVCIGGYA